MSAETLETLNTDTLIGFTDKRGTAWHYRPSLQGGEPNHYPGAIPVPDVERRLFSWTAESSPEQWMAGGRLQTSPTHKVIYRSDTGARLGTFTNGYAIHQFTPWLVGNVEAITDSALEVATAGLLRGGGQAWVQFELPETLQGPEGICHRPFITAGSSMDGSVATSYFTGSQLVVCDNTYTAAEASASGIIRVRHTAHSALRIAEARDMLGVVYATADAMDAELKALTSQYVTDEQWNSIVDRLAQPTADTPRANTYAEQRREAFNTLWKTDDRVAPWRNSGWGVVQAMNTFAAHVQATRGTDRFERNVTRLLTGEQNSIDAQARALLRAL